MSSFADVDRAADPSRCVDYLDHAAQGMGDTKARLRRLAQLDACDRWLDLGCGVGHDVAADPHGVGVDRSTKLLAEGRRRWPAAAVLAGDGNDLPFADRAFDGCRIERVLQHVVDPRAVMAEVRRVLRTGARVAVFEPDWASVTFATADEAVTREMGARTGARNRHGRIGRHLAALLLDAGLVDVVEEPETVVWRDLGGVRRVFGFDAVVDELLAEAKWSGRARVWRDDLEAQDRAGTFRAFLTRHFAVGVAP